VHDSAAALGWASDGFRRGAELWNRGRFWEAHEAWEEPWRAAGRHTAAGRLLQGLILRAAAGVKRQGGAETVARRLAARGARCLEGAAGAPGFDARAFAAEVERWVEGALPAPPRLREPPR
jgi:predicted metal-dependent hydrolase